MNNVQDNLNQSNNEIFLGIAHNWQLGFQIPGSPIMDGIVGLHNLLMVYLVFIVIFVTVMLVSACILFNETKVNSTLNLRHSSAVEASSTLSAVFILFMMASVSFSLLYSADEIMDSDVTYKVIGRQWYWTYEQTLKNPIKYYSNYLSLMKSSNTEFFNIISDTLKSRKDLFMMPDEEMINRKVQLLGIFGKFVSSEEASSMYIPENKFLRTVGTYSGGKDFINLSEDFYMMSDEEIINRKVQLLNIFGKLVGTEEANSIYIPEDRLLRTVGTYSDSLILPIRTHIRFLITSEDVIHSWAIPSLGIKMDAVPGRLNQLFTYIPYEGIYYGQCSELCGTNHGFMPIAIKAMNYDDFLSHSIKMFLLKEIDNDSITFPEVVNEFNEIISENNIKAVF